MCRPEFVIVLDELDKVEPGEVGLEKEEQGSKASLFSITVSREKQHEILKILSNMKYFLSTANAKFIFIAGREMYDIFLADVSDRNNYIGSIFNAVIYVPSFLTDYSVTAHADMKSLTEEFVCRKLIPHDYPVRSYDLKSYEQYLYDMLTERNIEQKEKYYKEAKDFLKNDNVLYENILSFDKRLLKYIIKFRIDKIRKTHIKFAKKTLFEYEYKNAFIEALKEIGEKENDYKNSIKKTIDFIIPKIRSQKIL